MSVSNITALMLHLCFHFSVAFHSTYWVVVNEKRSFINDVVKLRTVYHTTYMAFKAKEPSIAFQNRQQGLNKMTK